MNSIRIFNIYVILSISILGSYYINALDNNIKHSSKDININLSVIDAPKDLGIKSLQKNIIKDIEYETIEAKREIKVLKNLIKNFNQDSNNINNINKSHIIIKGEIDILLLNYIKSYNYTIYYPKAIERYLLLLKKFQYYKNYLCQRQYPRIILNAVNELIYLLEQYADKYKDYYIIKADQKALKYVIDLMSDFNKNDEGFKLYKSNLKDRLSNNLKLTQYSIKDLEQLNSTIEDKEYRLRKALSYEQSKK